MNLRTEAPEGSPAVSPADPGTRRPFSASQWGERYGLVVLLVAGVILFAVITPEHFLTGDNWRTLGMAQAVTAVLAIAVLIPLVSGNFDLSAGAIAISCSMVAASCMANYGWPWPLAVLTAVLVGMILGLANGLLVAAARLNGLIATIGTATVLQALLSWYSGDLPIATGISQPLLDAGIGSVFGIPVLVIIGIVVAVLIHYMLGHTPFGRRLAAIGANPSAARLVGIRVDRLTVISYVVAGGLAGLAGVLMLMHEGSANPGTDGISTLVAAMTVVFLGATALRPGEFNIPGMIVALLFAAVLVNGLTYLGVANWVSPLSYGLALILGVGLSAYFKAKRGG